MKHLTFLLSNKKKYKEAIQESQKDSYSSELVQIFSSLSEKKKLKKVLLKIKKDFPQALVVGATTAGEISHARMYDNTTTISLTLFKSSKLKASYAKSITKKSGKALSTKLVSKNTKAAIVLSEGLQGEDYEGFINAIKQATPDLTIAGGLAGDNFALKKTFVLLGEEVFEKGAVAVTFSGKKLFADNRYNLNWTPIGQEFTITAVDGNRVTEIDNENIQSIFKKYLGKNVFKNDAAELSNFQLLFKEGSTVVSRTPMALDGDAIIFAAPLKSGQKVQFGFSNTSSVISGSNEISKKINKRPAEAIYIYSCIARKTLLGNALENEFQPFENIAPTAGFFTYGEFYSTTNNNALLNCTTTILVLSESSSVAASKTKFKDTSNLDNSTFNALTHFIEQTSLELQENLKLLNEYKDVVDASSLVSKTDFKGNITYANDNFCHVSKYKREEIIGKNHNIIRDPKMSNFIFKKMWSTILSGKIWKGILSNRAKDGSIYYVNATIMPIFDSEGEIKEFIGIRQDVTKEMESKNRLKEKEQLIKAIFDNQDSIVIHASKTEGMLSVNKKLFDFFDYQSFEDFKNKNKCVCDLFLEEEGYIYPSKYPNWINDLSEDKFGENTKVKMLTKDDVTRTFNIKVKKIDNDYIINLNDITNLENAILKANASEQAKSSFLSNMSHEIRTPLNGILGFTDVLTKKELDKDSKRYVEIIHKSGQTLLNVVNDILDFSKIESGELSLYETESNLFKEMEAAMATFASVAKKKQLDFYIYIDTTIPTLLKCDVQRIKQVVNNLISNAIKFTPAEGEVKVKITLDSVINSVAQISFSVKDSGIGIEEAKLPTIFQAFSQADNSISREFGGTGLGLSISSQYIQMMHSKLQVNSKKGEGSEFHFTLELPVIDASYAIKNVISKSNRLNISILTADTEDCCAINDIVYKYLGAWQYQYDKVATLKEIKKECDILIISAKLFNQEACRNLLDTNENLQLLYIEGYEDNFNCAHKQFKLIEQPMTGSSLFDAIVTIANAKNKIVTQPSDEIKDVAITQQYEGKILVAEDNETNQLLISVMLEERGIDYTIVNNGQEAVDTALVQEYSLILMDVNMPVLDGMSATKILRKNDYTHPIVSLSANVIESDILSFKAAGVDDTLNKPIVPEQFDRVLSKYLQVKNKEDAPLTFDSVNVDKISERLKIADKTIILKLLNSFISSANSILEELQTEKLNKDITHKLKGITGNFNFDILYSLVSDYEEELDGWSEEDYSQNKDTLILHLKELIKQINLLS